ncbi:dual specificity protein phosphatase [Chthoniobacter flavus Ellin428]|uniref:Dual specificity protein phosphatase n=1 Tax=Chthoniobacter flavus Ellin428 TaxID=497964 RepID=B4CVF6_9BACT|nr:dual specificity protein phosphatase [Chthoniobacter flavus]EDY21398.1 dual specificity protein phosphatase [Chthoniobacter flavus Ellin428]TCO95359.1 dual specificity protein phosphatase-like protein [Chthoniobacter flavus]
MDWITESIAIGNYLDAENEELRRANDIRSMLCLNGKWRGVRPESIQLDALDTYDLQDGPGNNPDIFRRAVESVGRLSRLHPKLLVQCHAGRSRSVIVVVAHLMRTRGWSARETLSFVASKREIALTPGIESLLEVPFLRVAAP